MQGVSALVQQIILHESVQQRLDILEVYLACQYKGFPCVISIIIGVESIQQSF